MTAISESGGSWMRVRFPLAVLAGWFGGTVGARQAVHTTRNDVQAIEDPQLRDVYALLPDEAYCASSSFFTPLLCLCADH